MFDHRCQYGETGWIRYPKTTPYRHKRCELDMLKIIEDGVKCKGRPVLEWCLFVCPVPGQLVWTSV